MIPLAPSEWILMRCVWDLGQADPIEVAEHLYERYGQRELSPKTVGILLARLMQRGCLRATPALVERGRPRNVYSPLVTYEEAFEEQVDRVLSKLQVDEETLIEALEQRIAARKNRRKRRA